MSPRTIATLFLFLLTAITYQLKAQEPDLREKIGRMLIVSILGTDPGLNQDIVSCIDELKVGGIIIFEKWGRKTVNVESKAQLTSMIHSIRRRASYPIFIGVDQEGGKVARLKEKYGFPRTYSPQYIGNADDFRFTKKYAEEMASSMAETGFNMNFFPNLDININPRSPAIGKLERSFSRDPETVYRMAEIFHDIQLSHGIIPVFKHFPGHGSAMADSHSGFTDVSKTWQKSELDIYRRFIEAGKCEAIMCSHIYNSRLDKDYPASISKRILTDLMRDSLGFQGIFITDDIAMKALSEQWTTREILKLSINAGVDMLMILRGNAWYYNKIITMIEDMVLSGEIPESRIDESFRRIVQLQEKISLPNSAR